ncbi:hypothetical protein LSTR_LSTR013398 [Laodelphax striatellus]|uniref:Peptidase M13 N-terminal domain-containing protein n=1 Tax=Laodelphax striatellus TaxID=195883 RepID=A0A482WG28_LAOST|nr:hypothetical protein LSTR_LSTR013398 [Laodelphax striatellus]
MLYKTCTNIERLELDGLRPLLEQFEEWGGWPLLTNDWNPHDLNWQELLVYLSLNLDYSPLISTSVNVDRKNSNVHVITIDQPTLSLSRSMLVAPELYPVQISALKKWILDMAAIMGQQQTIDRELLMQIPIEVERMVNFEINLAKLTSPIELRRNGERIYNNMTIEDLQEWTDSASETEESMIDWLSLLKMLFQDTDIEIELTERVIVREIDYLFNLVRLMESTNAKTIVNFLFMRWLRVISTEMTIDMRRATFLFEQVFTGAQEEQIRWRDCIVTANQAMPMAMGYIYVQQYFDDEAKQSALEILKNIQTTYIEQLSYVSWMDNRTKMAAQDKLNAMSPAIGYPDWYHNITALETYYKNVNGLLTLGENMADNGGLQQAYLAYKKSLENGNLDFKLPGFENYTSDQLFFMGFALNWCEASSKESLLQEVLSDPHAPHRFRVLGSVANSHQFATAFNCSPGSPMNPEQKCSFW